MNASATSVSGWPATTLKKYLDEKQIEYIDVGCYSEEKVDYPDLAKAVCKQVQDKKADKGILICRSGYGMAIVANKFKESKYEKILSDNK